MLIVNTARRRPAPQEPLVTNPHPVHVARAAGIVERDSHLLVLSRSSETGGQQALGTVNGHAVCPYGDPKVLALRVAVLTAPLGVEDQNEVTVVHRVDVLDRGRDPLLGGAGTARDEEQRERDSDVAKTAPQPTLIAMGRCHELLRFFVEGIREEASTDWRGVSRFH